MSSFFDLTLDTTSPSLSLYVPTAINSGETFLVTVDSDEDLSTYQDCYFEDSASVQHPFTLLQTETDQYQGLVQLFGLAAGVGTIHIELKDEVYNASIVESGVVVLAATIGIRVCIDRYLRDVEMKPSIRTITIDSKQRDINFNQTLTRTITIGRDTRSIEFDLIEKCEE